MFCKNCGAQINDDAAFCDKCGQSTQAPGTNSKHKSKRKIILIAGIIAVLIFAISVVPKIFGSAEPIVGKWNTTVAVKDSEVIPIFSDGYINIKGNGTFSMWLDDDTKYSGTWERYDGSTNSDVGRLYLLEFKDSSGKGMLGFDDEKERVSVMIGDIMIVFKK